MPENEHSQTHFSTKSSENRSKPSDLLLRATAHIEPPDFSSLNEVLSWLVERGGTEVVVPVSVTDRDGCEVVRADITTWVTLSR